MKKALPPHGKLSKESKVCIQECVSEFISFVTSQAVDRCKIEKRKTLNGEDILWSMYSLGFENYSETLKIYLAKYRNFEQEEAERRPVKRRRNRKTQKIDPKIESYDSEGFNSEDLSPGTSEPIISPEESTRINRPPGSSSSNSNANIDIQPDNDDDFKYALNDPSFQNYNFHQRNPSVNNYLLISPEKYINTFDNNTRRSQGSRQSEIDNDLLNFDEMVNRNSQ